MKANNDAGFTLIELLIVVAIIGIIAAIAVPGLLRARMAGSEASAMESVRAVNGAQSIYAASCGGGFYSPSLANLAPGLQLLPDLAQSRILTLEMKELHDRLREDVVRSAERMPAEHFDFQPTPDVRTFGQLVGHVATNLYVMCAVAGTENNPHPALVEQTVSGKADLVDALKAAYDYCEEALASLNDVNGLNKAAASREGTRLSFLVAAIEHTSLHYGNMVTYMRLKGLVPASSDRRDVVPPAAVQDQQPPADSPPLMRRLSYRFPTQDNRSLRFVRTYVLPAETPRHVSFPSQDRWVSYSEAEPVILDDAERFWKSGQFESLWVDVVDRPFENGVVGRLVIFNFVEQADIEIPRSDHPPPPPEYRQPPAGYERLYPPPGG